VFREEDTRRKKVIPSGFEPETHRLEICCSIQLSYGTIFSIRKKKIQALFLNLLVGVAGFEPTTSPLSAGRDTVGYSCCNMYCKSDSLFLKDLILFSSFMASAFEGNSFEKMRVNGLYGLVDLLLP
jgi:hypothetical protein